MNSSSNSTSSPLGTDESGPFMGVVYLLISSLVLATNALVILVLANTKMLQAPAVFILTHMAFWDFMQGLNVLIFVVPSAFLNKFAYRQEVLGVAACVSSFLVGLSAFNTASVVLDRYISVIYPLKYRKLTARHAGITAFVLITLSIIRMCLIAFPDTDFHFAVEAQLPASNYNTIQGTLASIVSNLFAFGTIIISSLTILIKLKRRNRRVHALRPINISRHMVKVSLMVLVSSGVFCLSFVPLMICILINYAFGFERTPKIFLKVAIVCIMSNSIWNALVYTVQSKDFRNSLIHIFCKSYYLNQRRQRQIGTTGTKEIFVVSKQSASTAC